MSHFAQIGEFDGDLAPVLQVLVIDQDVVDTGAFGDPASWIQTSYNTYGGAHTLGGTPLRKNFAGVGYSYSASRNAFVAPKPADNPSFVLDESTCQWAPPTPRPSSEDGGMYSWDESTLSWRAA